MPPGPTVLASIPPIVISPTDYLRLVLDPIRLAVLGAAAAGPVDVETLAERMAIDRREVLAAVGRLRAAGLLTDDLELDRRVLQTVGAALPDHEPAAADVTEGPWSPDEAEVLSRFFQGRRLTQIPMTRTKRLVVLERLAQEFEPGRRYPEREVNRILQVFHEDYAALRRHLVDEGMLSRADGDYWRTGGRYVPVT